MGILFRPNNNELDILLSQTSIESRSLTTKKPISCKEETIDCEDSVSMAPALTNTIELCISILQSLFLPSILRILTLPISISESAIHAFLTSMKSYLILRLTVTSSIKPANVPSPSPVPKTTTCKSSNSITSVFSSRALTLYSDMVFIILLYQLCD